MPYPVSPALTYSYEDFATALGDGSFPGIQLDIDLTEIDRAVTDLNTFVQLALRSDGALGNGVVTLDSLEASFYNDLFAAVAVAAPESAAASAAAAAVSAAAALVSQIAAAASAALAEEIVGGAGITLNANNLSDMASAATARTNLGLAIGTNVQAFDATLSGLAALTTAADQLVYATGVNAFAMASLTAFARTILDDADAAAVRTTLGLVIGTNVQAVDATLTALAGLTVAADKLIYATGADAFATTDITAAGRALLDDASATVQRTTLGLGTMAVENSAAFAKANDQTSATATVYPIGTCLLAGGDGGSVTLARNATTTDLRYGPSAVSGVGQFTIGAGTVLAGTWRNCGGVGFQYDPTPTSAHVMLMQRVL